MLGKLIKHEFIATRRTIPLIAAVSLFFVGLYWLGDRLEIAWLSTSSLVLAILGIVGLSIVTSLVLILRLFKSQYGEEGYLTHTLPVRPSQILLSKLLIAALWIILSLAVTIGASILLLAPLVQSGGALHEIWEMIKQVLRSYPSWQLWLVCIYYAIIASLSFFSQITFAITLGNTSSFHKHPVAFSVVIYLVVNFILGQLSSIIMMLIPPCIYFTSTGIELYTGNMLSWSMALQGSQDFTGFAFGIVGFIVEPLISVTLLLLSYRLMTRKLSIR